LISAPPVARFGSIDPFATPSGNVRYLRIPLIPSEILVQTPPQLMAMIESVARASIFCDCAALIFMTARVRLAGEVA